MTEWLSGTFVATSLLMVAVLCLREPVRRQFGASAAYGLWLLPAARMVLPPMTRTVERVVPSAPADHLAFASFTAAPAATSVALPSPTLLETLGGWTTILVTLWLVGAAVMLAGGLFAYRAQRRRVLAEGQQLARLGAVRIVRSTAVGGPMAFGFFDRVIVLPADFEGRWDERQRRLALDHELAHHQSGDLVANAIAFVLLCLQWFNPLAWVSHRAFRFDQEAACDARVLDRAVPDDRAAYGRAIAKAASGRALLFAGALDRPNTLHRRLNSMLTNPSSGRRRAGRVLLAAGLAGALPLTATYATQYIDVPAPPAPPAVPTVPTLAPLAPAAPASPVIPAMAPLAPAGPAGMVPAVAPVAPVAYAAAVPRVAPAAPVAAVARLAAIAAVAPTPPTAPAHVAMSDGGMITVHGKTKRWEDLTPAERAQVRRDLAKAKQEIQRSRVNMDRDMAQARAEMEKFRNGDFEREMADARREVEQALREVDASSAEMRRAGVDPEKIKAEIRRSLVEVSKMDIAKIKREAMASFDEEAIRKSISEAERSIDEMQARLDRADRPDR